MLLLRSDPLVMGWGGLGRLGGRNTGRLVWCRTRRAESCSPLTAASCALPTRIRNAGRGQCRAAPPMCYSGCTGARGGDWCQISSSLCSTPSPPLFGSSRRTLDRGFISYMLTGLMGDVVEAGDRSANDEVLNLATLNSPLTPIAAPSRWRPSSPFAEGPSRNQLPSILTYHHPHQHHQLSPPTLTTHLTPNRPPLDHNSPSKSTFQQSLPAGHLSPLPPQQQRRRALSSVESLRCLLDCPPTTLFPPHLSLHRPARPSPLPLPMESKRRTPVRTSSGFPLRCILNSHRKSSKPSFGSRRDRTLSLDGRAWAVEEGTLEQGEAESIGRRVC